MGLLLIVISSIFDELGGCVVVELSDLLLIASGERSGFAGGGFGACRLVLGLPWRGAVFLLRLFVLDSPR